MSLKNKKIRNYTLTKFIDQGGMAEIWLATNPSGEQVAVKVLFAKYSEDVQILSRFEQEARIMLNLKHKNIRKVYNIDNVANRPAIIMEYLEGMNLSKFLSAQGRLSTKYLPLIWNQCVEGLNYVHKLNIVHRDIKPSNLFLTNDGVLKIIDFGISKDNNSNQNLTTTGTKIGTLWYMSPEQIRSLKYVNKTSDAYSLAVTFVHMASGKTPYGADKLGDYDLQIKIVEKPIELNGVPIEWQSFLKSFLEKRAEDRKELKPFLIYESTEQSRNNFKSKTSLNVKGNKTQLISNTKSEKQVWKECKNKNTVESYTLYLNNYPHGAYRENAQNEIGDIYYFGKNGVARNHLKSFNWFKMAAFYENAYANYSLGYMYKMGQGVSKDYKKAFTRFQLSANKGNSSAQFELGNMYTTGKGVPKDNAMAYKYYKMASSQGNSYAQYQLGHIYLQGYGVSQNSDKAIFWYEKSANNGNLKAQYYLGDIYYFGKIGFKRYTKAISWYRKAAERGYAPAQDKLGDLYYNGDRILRDNYKALKWYSKAAEQGYSIAQFKIGRMYYIGDRISKDLNEAAKWLQKAAHQGNENAIEILKKLK